MHAPFRDLLSRLRPWHGTVMMIAALFGYAVFVWTHAVVVPGGADSSGYFNTARLLGEGRVSEPARELPGLPMREMPVFMYVPLGFIPNAEQTALIPTYPTGLPLMLAGSAKLAGWHYGPLLVMVLHGVAGLFVTYQLARVSGVNCWVAAIGAAALGFSPVYVMFTLQAMSDVPALVWCGLALLCVLRPGRNAALACGFAIGMAVLIRPTNVLIGLPVLLAARLDWRRWLGVALGGLPAALAFALYNRAAYGSPFSTGYGPFFNTLFSGEWVPRTLAHYGQWLPALLSPLIVLVLVAPWVDRAARRTALVHGSWCVLVAGFYAAYYHTHETWWYLRFLLPIFPSLIVLAALGGQRLLERARPALQASAAAAAAVIAISSGHYWCKHFVAHHAGFHEQVYPTLLTMVAEEVPANGIVLAMQASGTLFHSTPRKIVRWDTIDNAWPAVRASAAKNGNPLYAALFEFELREGFAAKVPGHWRKVREAGHVSLWRLEDEP